MTPARRPIHLFTDIEGSTRLWEEQPERMRLALARHDALARQAVQAHGGRVVKTTGDGLHAVFFVAADALAATLQLQHRLADAQATEGLALAVRCGLHAGADEVRDDDYYGPDVNRAARIMSVAHGGQVLVSDLVAGLCGAGLPQSIALKPLGPVRLRGLDRPEPVHQLCAPGLRAEFPPLRGLAEVPHNLPQSLNRFVGRDQALHELAGLLHAHRLVTLWGPGGIGKSRLSLQLGAQLLERFADGVWLVELAPVDDPARVPQAVAAALGVKESPGQPLAEALARHVGERRLLLVLDNCEHVHAAAAALAKQLLQQGAGLRIVATSRELLHVAGERAYPVPALSVPLRAEGAGAAAGPLVRPTPEALLGHDAVRLFVDRARLVQPAFALDTGNAAAVVDICQRLDGIPLALELAAARLRAMPLATLAERLRQSLRLVATQDQTVAPRQRTLQLLIDWSWDLLSPPERLLLARLSVFAGGFTLDAAEAVCADEQLPADEVLDLLGQLVDKSLVAVQSGGDGVAVEGRWRLLETIRVVVAAKQPPEDGRAVQRRWCKHCAGLAEAGAAALDGPEQAVWLARLDADRPNLLAAHAAALAEEDPLQQPDALAAAWRLGFALRDYCINRGLLSVALQMVTAALDHPLARAPDAGRARGLFDAGQLCNRLGRYAEARAALADSLEIVRGLNAPQREAAILQPLGQAFEGLGDADQALMAYEQAIQISRSLALPAQLMSSLVCLALWQQSRAQWHEAERLYQEALALAVQLGLPGAEATVRLNLAMVVLQLGHGTQASGHLRDALAQVRAATSAMHVLAVLDLCCGLAVERHDWASAHTAQRAAQALGRRTGLCRAPADEAVVQGWWQRLQAARSATPAPMAGGGEGLSDDSPAALLDWAAEWLKRPAVSPPAAQGQVTTG